MVLLARFAAVLLEQFATILLGRLAVVVLERAAVLLLERLSGQHLERRAAKKLEQFVTRAVPRCVGVMSPHSACARLGSMRLVLLEYFVARPLGVAHTGARSCFSA